MRAQNGTRLTSRYATGSQRRASSLFDKWSLKDRSKGLSVFWDNERIAPFNLINSREINLILVLFCRSGHSNIIYHGIEKSLFHFFDIMAIGS